LTAPPPGAVYGVNVHGANQPYAGPHTHGAAKQAYHLQVFALDTVLPNDPSLSFEALTQAMKGHVLASGALTGLAAKPAEVAANGPVRIETGLLAGVAARDPSITVYKGIPYAAPPVGPLRFRPPSAPATWTGVRQADRFGSLCPQPQGGGPPPSGAMDEDCLTLNVWTGATSKDEKRPVLVWIYGGGFLNGTGANPEFDGEGLAKKGVIVVTFNYRLGALGFLATPELSAESGHKASGNYGLLDDIAALKWVQRNIAAFGGDPDPGDDRRSVGGRRLGGFSHDVAAGQGAVPALDRREPCPLSTRPGSAFPVSLLSPAEDGRGGRRGLCGGAWGQDAG
jgi:para-nitrobenzyl esterase